MSKIRRRRDVPETVQQPIIDIKAEQAVTDSTASAEQAVTLQSPVTPINKRVVPAQRNGAASGQEKDAVRGELIAHCGTRKISFEELQSISVPETTRTHKPVAHHEIVFALMESLAFRHITCVRSEFAVSPDGMKCFGVLDLDAEFNGCRFAIGMRNSHDKSMRLAMTVGLRVQICDNMAFKGDFTPVLAKHSRNLNLIDSISVGVDKIQRNFEPLRNQVIRWQQEYLSNEQAKLIIYSAFMEKKLKAPNTLMQVVHNCYFIPMYDEFKDPTLWSLANSFTSAFKTLKPVRQFQVTAKLGDFLEQYAK
jgi:hypothetical protein